MGQLPAQAQVKLDGQVRDARTQKPLAYASVFLANTTYGTTTDSTGHFQLAGLPGGRYEFMVSYVGYLLYTKTVDLQQAATVVASLEPAPAQLGEVVVRPTKNRPGDFQKFMRQFLGNSTLSRQCRIENPQDVVVVFDEKRQELFAVAPHNLQVINQALGYRITYHNFDFKVYYRANRCEFVSAPRFEELKSTDAKQQRRWEENRRLAYAGSFPHFLRSVLDQRVEEEGFLVRAMVSEPNSAQAQARVAAAGDSLAQVLTPEPGVLTRIYKQPLSAAQIRSVDAKSGRVKLKYPYDGLQVTYQNERPDAVYAAHMAILRRNQMMESAEKRWAAKSQTALGRQVAYESTLEVSALQLLGPEAWILPTGHLTNPLSIKVDGYWGFEKEGEALPLDYTPPPLLK
nr:carboxypeptidase-like regulatory domain-containing protein [Hymenobacter sp. BT770]